MNEIQRRYAETKAAYDLAFKQEKWDLVEEIEDDYIKAEFAMLNWTFDQMIKTGKIDPNEAEIVKGKLSVEQMKKFADMGMRLAV